MLNNIKQIKLVGIIMLVLTLQGCAVATVVAITAGATMVSDRRSIGNQIDDQTIEFNVHNELAKQKSIIDNTNLHVVSVNGSVLIVGQAPNTYLRDLAIKTVTEVEGVVQIHNQIRISSTTAVTTQTNDIWLTSKVKSALFASDKVNVKDIKVVTENGEVFLMGLVSKNEADAAVSVTRNISGVSRVFKAFEYL
ncbi:division/outer membrane stress-associated lipid-binding lipoprotein [Colwellia sp. RSH04]|uniref:division/outer membrane stress-associated lipid-binding lipoprotein n=1 Tax=Colwellia sp. RSH04 TaxID=2305464 RepID=UPI000E57FB19|nr:division/outer membrane stress-associated lipid-binding lipoprotein [Colwellia sp. RSH04]RHW76691.1 osmotically-inducible protein OsmY [Colwellia sp. RSH04]